MSAALIKYQNNCRQTWCWVLCPAPFFLSRSLLAPGYKVWTEIKKYGKICIRNDVVKLKFEGVTIYEVFIFAWTRTKTRQLE